MKIRLFFVAGCIISAFFLVSCELEKTIGIELPAQQRQLVAEAYAEKGKVLRVLLTESEPYFDSLRFPLADSAFMLLESEGRKDTLKPEPILDLPNRKFYNYVSRQTLNPETGRLNLSIQHKNRQLRGSTVFLEAPQLVSVDIEYNPSADSSVRFLFWIRDFPGGQNYYRIILNEDSLTGSNVLEFTFTDNNLDGQLFPVGTSYRFKKNSRYILRLFHIEQAYYNYLRSMDAADRANGNPFAQPSTVKSPMEGDGYGIFTTLNFIQQDLFP